MFSLRKAILKTLAYADVFDYPLTVQEVNRFLITDRPQDFPLILEELNQFVSNGLVRKKDNYYFLKDRAKIVALRRKRRVWSEEKLKIASRMAGRLRRLPWIRMVAITGALTMENTTETDDIDFLIVTAHNRLWLTRLLTVILLELVGCRRHPGDQEFKDKPCLNMFLDEESLKLPLSEQNLFTAHEVCQLHPVWDRGAIYQRFLKENLWAEKYLANFFKKSDLPFASGSKKRVNVKLGNRLVNFLEFLVYRGQLTYMRPRQTREIAEPFRARFHPQDCRDWVLEKYRRRLREFKDDKGKKKR
jgi:hypothetical protein